MFWILMMIFLHETVDKKNKKEPDKKSNMGEMLEVLWQVLIMSAAKKFHIS